MRRLKNPIAIAVSLILTAGLLYSAVCDASCALFGCSSVAQTNQSQTEDPHAHCHAKKAQDKQSAASSSRIVGANHKGHSKSGQIPECELHAVSTMLLPRAIGGSLSSLHLLDLDLAQPADFDFGALSRKPVRASYNARFRPPPSLAMLSALLI